MQNPWRAEAAKFHQLASDAGDPHLRGELEMVALAYSRAADFRSRADREPNPYFHDEFARIAAGYASMASRRGVTWSDGETFPHEDR